MLSLIYWRTHMLSAGVRRHWRTIERLAWLNPAAARAEMGRRLLAQMRYFGTRSDALPEWREAAAIQSPEDLWRVWAELPILTKDDLRNHFAPDAIRAHCGPGTQVSATGGSTGEPVRFLHDRHMLRVGNAARLYARRQLGWRPGSPLICVWGSERDIGRDHSLKSRVGSRLRNRWLVDGYCMNDATVERVLSLIRRLGPVAIYGFTSMLDFVAGEVLSRGDVPPAGSVRAAWNGGEMLFASQSDLFKRAFGVPILNLYGGRELSTMAFQPAWGKSLRVMRPFVFVEIVDEAGRPVAPGETGRLIWTSTVCRGTPFLRYDIGDLGTAAAEDQDESGICRLTSLCGRRAGLLKVPGGKTLSMLFWNHLFKEFSEVVQFQVALIGQRGIELRLRGRRFTREREMELRRILLNFLGPVQVDVVWLNAIPLTQQGKLLQVVREAA